MLDFVALNYLGRGGNLSPNVNRGILHEAYGETYNNPDTATVGQNLRGLKEWFTMQEIKDAKGLGIMVILYIIIWIFAIYRALQCRNNMRIVHLFFATMNPILYLVFSFTLKDFC